LLERSGIGGAKVVAPEVKDDKTDKSEARPAAAKKAA
jgi:hypothetical protein